MLLGVWNGRKMGQRVETSQAGIEKEVEVGGWEGREISDSLLIFGIFPLEGLVFIMHCLSYSI